MSIISIIEAPIRLFADVAFSKYTKSAGKTAGSSSKGRRSNKKVIVVSKGKKTGYGKNFPNYSDRNKNMSNAKKIREKYSGLK